MQIKYFQKAFSTEEKCLDYLFKLRWGHGYRCPRCNHNEMWEIKAYKYKCKKCGYQTTVTAGTLFQDTHMPMQVWFQAMWWYTSIPRKKRTAAELQRELGLGSNRTALLMFKKMKRARNRFRPRLCKLQGTIKVTRTSISFKGQKRNIAIAVEVVNGKAGRIRIEEIKPLSPWPESFVTSVAEPTVQIKPLSAPAFITKIRSMLEKQSPTNSLDNHLNAFCRKHNGKKMPITFEQLLKTAVHTPPQPRTVQK